MRNYTLLALAAATLAVANLSAAQEQPAQSDTVPAPVAGDTLTVPAPTSIPASVTAVPARGTSMDGVKTKFGAPLQEGPPVGTPAITRWDYSGFAVFFENDKVLHTVIAR
jgi:hypothetical protein